MSTVWAMEMAVSWTIAAFVDQAANREPQEGVGWSASKEVVGVRQIASMEPGVWVNQTINSAPGAEFGQATSWEPGIKVSWATDWDPGPDVGSLK